MTLEDSIQYLKYARPFPAVGYSPNSVSFSLCFPEQTPFTPTAICKMRAPATRSFVALSSIPLRETLFSGEKL